MKKNTTRTVSPKVLENLRKGREALKAKREMLKDEPVIPHRPERTHKEEDIYDAMGYAQDVLERAQMPFILLGDTAYQVYNQKPLNVTKVILGVLFRHAVKECVSLLPAIDPHIVKLSDGWELRRHGVPVYIKIVPKLYPELLEPDVVFYKYDTWKVPNPFNKYWEGDHYDI